MDACIGQFSIIKFPVGQEPTNHSISKNASPCAPCRKAHLKRDTNFPCNAALCKRCYDKGRVACPGEEVGVGQPQEARTGGGVLQSFVESPSINADAPPSSKSVMHNVKGPTATLRLATIGSHHNSSAKDTVYTENFDHAVSPNIDSNVNSHLYFPDRCYAQQHTYGSKEFANGGSDGNETIAASYA
ncbi:hypothetical protein BD410DRAFT_844824 [Rickenella mellea]|uniref:Uncharacterized protein n=1 Tax=Rickenella mellea TaxID=50990 RepID=A0A4Y7PLR9_9AGAM|nr:hypothetical protein BD410DRAFT_844824 [Rickenella mellea]